MWYIVNFESSLYAWPWRDSVLGVRFQGGPDVAHVVKSVRPHQVCCFLRSPPFAILNPKKQKNERGLIWFAGRVLASRYILDMPCLFLFIYQNQEMPSSRRPIGRQGAWSRSPIGGRARLPQSRPTNPLYSNKTMKRIKIITRIKIRPISYLKRGLIHLGQWPRSGWYAYFWRCLLL